VVGRGKLVSPGPVVVRSEGGEMNTLDLEASIAQQDWDARARKNALHYICSERNDWDLESFFQSGENDYAALVAPFLTKLRFITDPKAVLEVGCGVGRVTCRRASECAVF
jgi:2-polyprenyl-3-methyl-5-hydroxy-6-metoxy-1,4-benzoquinol methylase